MTSAAYFLGNFPTLAARPPLKQGLFGGLRPHWAIFDSELQEVFIGFSNPRASWNSKDFHDLLAG